MAASRRAKTPGNLSRGEEAEGFWVFVVPRTARGGALLEYSITPVAKFHQFLSGPGSAFHGMPTKFRMVRTSNSRPSGMWSVEDYDVFDGDQHVGRIFWSYAAPGDRPWIWSITCRYPQSPEDHGIAATREEAVAKFKARWRPNS